MVDSGVPCAGSPCGVPWGSLNMGDRELEALLTEAFGDLDAMPVPDVDTAAFFEEPVGGGRDGAV